MGTLGLNLFAWPARVYYEDTDAGGVVYHANYLHFLERGRTEWLRHLGFEQDQLLTEFKVLFVVKSMQIEYKRPARFNEELEILINRVDLRRASMELEQSIIRNNPTKNELIVSAHVNVVCVDSLKFSPCPIPSPVVREINACQPS